MKRYKATLLMALTIFIFASCTKKEVGPENETGQEDSKIAPDGFNFQTTKKVDVTVKLLSNINEPLKGVIVEINSTAGLTLLKGASDKDGYFKGSVNIPAYMDTLLISPSATGLVQNVKGLVVDNKLNCTIGGEAGVSGNVVMLSNGGGKSYFQTSSRTFGLWFTPMGKYDVNGRPTDYLESSKGAVSAELLGYLTESLPEKKNLKLLHPEFLASNVTEHLNIVKNSDIYVTYVSEGATNANTLGYYTYTTNNPPQNVNKLDEVKIVFPNTSSVGSGGGMKSGDKVKLGNFSAGTSIGFVLISSGWNSSLKTFNPNNTKYYSYSPFNPESSSSLQTHSILLNYGKENLFIVGFEDLPRDNSGTDHDFNDVIIYATATTAGAISPENVSLVSSPKDTDGDGVLDMDDEFVNDPDKAFISYFPSASTKGTLAFEDNWPKRGDYDMNDLVVNYRYAYVSNANNKVVEMIGNYSVVAAWAQNHNGFGVQLPFAQNLVKSITGQKFIENYITLNPNGTETGQTKAVIIPFDNHNSLIQNNIDIIDSVSVKVSFVNPVDISILNDAPYNPFLIPNKQRGYEIHLAGNLPTDKANISLFGTEHDRTNPKYGKYYLSADNWPWALSFTEEFSYPREGNAINNAYLHFYDWTRSAGWFYTDWYKSTRSGYRDESKIYSK